MLGLFGKPSRDRFAKLIMSEARRSGISSDLEYDPTAYTLRHADMRGYLGNAYNEYLRAKGDHKKQIISNFVALLRKESTPIEKDDAVSKLVAVVRDRALFTLSSLHREIESGSAAEVPVATEAISEWFTKALVLDFPGHVAVVSKSHLERWGLSFDEAFEIGVNRLRDATTAKCLQEDRYFVPPVSL